MFSIVWALKHVKHAPSTNLIEEEHSFPQSSAISTLTSNLRVQAAFTVWPYFIVMTPLFKVHTSLLAVMLKKLTCGLWWRWLDYNTHLVSLTKKRGFIKCLFWNSTSFKTCGILCFVFFVMNTVILLFLFSCILFSLPHPGYKSYTQHCV